MILLTGSEHRLMVQIQMKNLGGGDYGMFSADGNRDGGIYGEDYILYQTSQGEEGYRIEDYNMDGGVYGEDYILYQTEPGLRDAWFLN